MILRQITVLFFTFMLFTGCGSNFEYSETFSIPGNAWTYADTATFAVPITDTTARYNLYLDIDHTTEYSFENMYVKIHTNFPSGKRLSEQVNIDMANKAGVWHGDCRGENCQLRVNLQRNAYFNEVGTYQLTFEQFMRVDSLEGIERLAFKMEQVEN